MTSLSVVVNGEAAEFARALSVAQLLEGRGLVGKRVAVERNGEIVPRSRHAVTWLEPDDRLEIVVAVGGG
jgi:sulfur carrier protein